MAVFRDLWVFGCSIMSVSKQKELKNGSIDEAKQMLNSLLGTTGIALGIVSGTVLGIGKIILGGA
ncbi:hypothetical protein [uncultured Helicobacter sp.]|uniref:hypothetical protein n=1 Tax=uncultured Helicobacter sp. TaxID=175537 RepID=UPI00374ED887